MVKRKASTQGDLRSSPIVLSMTKVPSLSLCPWNIPRSQAFFPPLESLFKTDDLQHVHEYGLRFPDPISAVVNETDVRLLSGKVLSVHLKKTMLLNPFKWMKGDYGLLGLPISKSHAEEVHSKLQSPHNAGYVGSILSVALSQSECIHFPKVYGVYTGTSTKHAIDISDEYEELSERKWFSQNIGKTFQVSLNEEITHTFSYTRSARPSLLLGDDIDLGMVEEIDGIPHEDGDVADMTPVFQEDEVPQAEDECSDLSTSYVFNIESLGTSDVPSEIADAMPMEAEEEDDEPFAWASFSDVPVQITVMEKCEGLFYKLLKSDTNVEHQMAWFAQVIFALAFAQRNFGFTHNDLHANNVMYNKTSVEYLYYIHGGIQYRVPTYGYLIKIIDFDRGIGYVRLPGMKEPKLFMSDQFAPNEEAGGQYNMHPFFHAKYPTLKPNPSFDLVRLATSLFWDLFPYGPRYDAYAENPIFKMFVRWMTLPDGSSVLFHKVQPKVDRYPGFHVYKAIARYCKDTAVPRKEIGELNQFVVPSIPAGQIPLVIDI
jgi:hypothetical protein